VSGGITGQSVEESAIGQVYDAIHESGVPILINTGFKTSNAASLLRYADGAVVGSSLKFDGITWNRVDRARVGALMAAVADAG
jgi:predicted TIM-barrel enzyme